MQESVTTSFANVIAGETPRFKVLEVEIAASQTVAVGTVLGSNGVSAAGETFSVCNSAATVGEGNAATAAPSSKPVCVALEAVTTEAGKTAKIKACFQGVIDVTLSAGGSDTAYTHVDALRARGIYLAKKI